MSLKIKIIVKIVRNIVVMDNGNYNCQIPLLITTIIGFKIFKLFDILLEYFISQLLLSWTAVLCTILVIILIFKLI